MPSASLEPRFSSSRDVPAGTRKPPRRGSGESSERGQASLELLAGIPLLVIAALLALQLLAAGYAATLVDGAAEAGALAIAAGGEPAAAVEDALPGWAASRVESEVDRGNVRVTVEPPAIVPGLGKHLAVTSSAWVNPPEQE